MRHDQDPAPRASPPAPLRKQGPIALERAAALPVVDPCVRRDAGLESQGCGISPPSPRNLRSKYPGPRGRRPQSQPPLGPRFRGDDEKERRSGDEGGERAGMMVGMER